MQDEKINHDVNECADNTQEQKVSIQGTKYSHLINSAMNELDALNSRCENFDILEGIEEAVQQISLLEEIKQAAMNVVANGHFEALPCTNLPFLFLPKNSGLFKQKRVYPDYKVLGYVEDVIPHRVVRSVSAPKSHDGDLDTLKVINSYRAVLLSSKGELHVLDYTIQRAVSEATYSYEVMNNKHRTSDLKLRDMSISTGRVIDPDYAFVSLEEIALQNLTIDNSFLGDTIFATIVEKMQQLVKAKKLKIGVLT